MILSLAGMLISSLLWDLLLLLYRSYLGRLPTPLRLEETGILCAQSGQCLAPLWNSHLLRNNSPTGEDFKFLRYSTRSQRIKAGLWVIVNYLLFNGIVHYFVTYSWWFTTNMAPAAPYEQAWIQWFIGDIKKCKATRTFGNLPLIFW